MDQNLTSNLTDPNGCPLPQSTLFAASCQLFAYSTIFVLSVFGNCILIGAITSHFSRTQSHAVMNYYIINMAAADLFTTVFDIGIQVYHYGLMVVNKQFEWFDGIAGVFLCKFIVFIQGAAIACSVVTIAAIAINRFLAVMYPFRRSRRNSTVVLVISLTWISSFAIASPMLYAMQVQNVDGALYCMENWEPLFDNQSSPRHYTLALFFSLFVCPLTIIGTLYSIIAFKVWVRTVPGHITGANQQHEIKTKKKILKICMTVVLVFALCWLPFYVYLIFHFVSANFSCGAPDYVVFLGLIFGHANSAINPFIYVVYNSDYQKGMKKIIVKLCRCPCKSNRVCMRKTRGTLESMPSLRSFRELALTSL